MKLLRFLSWILGICIISDMENAKFFIDLEWYCTLAIIIAVSGLSSGILHNIKSYHWEREDTRAIFWGALSGAILFFIIKLPVSYVMLISMLLGAFIEIVIERKGVRLKNALYAGAVLVAMTWALFFANWLQFHR